jgi:hypothetical protein
MQGGQKYASTTRNAHYNQRMPQGNLFANKLGSDPGKNSNTATNGPGVQIMSHL